MRRFLVSMTVTVLLSLAACGSNDVPYTAKEMQNAQDNCEVQELATTMEGGTLDDGEKAQFKCLQGSLPKLSDEQLNRLDYMIEQAGGSD